VRRARRRGRSAPTDRVEGGWQEILVLLKDLWIRTDPLLTRQELAAQLQSDIPATCALSLAGRADRAIFGPDDLPPQASEEYWQQEMAVRRTMMAMMYWHMRLFAMFSLRSFGRSASDRRAAKRRTRANRRARAQGEKQAVSMRRRRSSMRSTVTTSARKGLFR